MYPACEFLQTATTKRKSPPHKNRTKQNLRRSQKTVFGIFMSQEEGWDRPPNLMAVFIMHPLAGQGNGGQAAKTLGQHISNWCYHFSELVMNVIAWITPTSNNFKINYILLFFQICLAAIVNPGRGEIPQLYFCFADHSMLSYPPTHPGQQPKFGHNNNILDQTAFWCKYSSFSTEIKSFYIICLQFC